MLKKKAFDNVQPTLMIKGKSLALIKDIYEKSKANIIFNSKELNVSHKIKQKPRMSILISSTQHWTGLDTRGTAGREENSDWRGNSKSVFTHK